MADTPKRIQRRRVKGWRMPEGAIYVGRPTKWGNPFKVPTPSEISGITREEAHDIAVKVYGWELMIEGPGFELAQAAKRELRGHDLVCWCRLDEPCHADVLLRVANE